jgi:hypothetical protein
MVTCFGRGDPARQARCSCPRSCQRLCRRITFTEDRCPRVHNRHLGRPFTPVPNQVLESWGTNEVAAEVKLTYLFLITRTRPTARWIRTPLRLLAEKRGVCVKTLREHLGRLRDIDLILLPRMSLLTNYDPGPRYSVVVLDLPAWMPSDVKTDEVDEVDEVDRATMEELLAEVDAEDDDDDDDADDGDPDEELRLARAALRR